METDLELMFPDEYISSVSERMNLYRALDAVKDENALEEYQKNLVDRFGPIPGEAKNLIQLVRLRWVAQETGFEKVVLKHGRMSCFFVSGENSSYFQSAMFGRVLNYLQSHAARCQLKQFNQKRAIVFQDVCTVEDAVALLRSIAGQKAGTA